MAIATARCPGPRQRRLHKLRDLTHSAFLLLAMALVPAICSDALSGADGVLRAPLGGGPALPRAHALRWHRCRGQPARSMRAVVSGERRRVWRTTQ